MITILPHYNSKSKFFIPHQSIQPTKQKMVGWIMNIVYHTKIVIDQIPSGKDVDVYADCDVHETSVL